jgi:hypothetical protein
MTVTKIVFTNVDDEIAQKIADFIRTNVDGNYLVTVEKK